MRAVLLHNPRAGQQGDAEDLCRQIAALGWDVCDAMEDVDEAIANQPDVIVVAGGDGTVGRVAKRLSREGGSVAMAVVPAGTANNVARTLGIPFDAAKAVRGLADATEIAFDVGSLRWNGGGGSFVEGFGIGVFAYLIGACASSKDKGLDRAHDLLADELSRYRPARVHLEIDGEDASGEYLVVAIQNARTVGPALRLAPCARVDDGELDVVLVTPEHRGEWIERLRRARGQAEVPLPHFDVRRARQVKLRADGRWGHADDEASTLTGDVDVAVHKGAVRMLVPRP